MERLDELERRLERLERRASAKPAPVESPRILPTADGAITTAALADLLKIRRGTFNARISRAGGAAPGLVIDGWRCIGKQVPSRGGPAQALWQRH